MSEYFPKPSEHSGKNIKIELDLSHHAAKADFKKVTGIDTSSLAEKSDLASLKAEVDKINIDKLKTVPDDLSKLSNVADSEVVKNLCMIN